jgi:hypothetical protein
MVQIDSFIPSPGNILMQTNRLVIPSGAKPGVGHFGFVFSQVPAIANQVFRSADLRVRTTGWFTFQDSTYQDRCFSFNKMGGVIDPINDSVTCGEAFRFQGVVCVEHSGSDGQTFGGMVDQSVCRGLDPHQPPIYVPCDLPSCTRFAWFSHTESYSADESMKCNVACRPDIDDPNYTTLREDSLRYLPIWCIDLDTGAISDAISQFSPSDLYALGKQRLWCDLDNLPPHIDTIEIYPYEMYGVAL